MSLNWLAIRICLVMIILIASLSGAPVLAQGAATVRVDPSASSVQVNDTASIAIKVDSIANLTAFELHLSFDPAVLEVTSMTNGGFVAADFAAQNKFDNGAGTIDYAVAQMNRAPAQGNGTLLNIVFRAKGAGSTTVTTRATQAAPDGLLFADQNGIAIQVSWVPGNINVGVGTPTNTDTPPPTTTVPTTVVPTTPGPTKPAPTTPVSTTSVPTTPVSTTPVPITPPPTITPTPGTLGTHVVRWGEWVYCIARAYRVSPWAIIQTNHLWWPYIIFPNQRLTIPNIPWTNMTAGPVCQAQFTFPAPTPTPTSTPVTPAVTVTPAPPSVTPIPVTTAPPPTCRATYVVRPGDTLYSIARRYGTTYTEIARVNGIPNPRLIYPGQQLCIP